MLRMLVGLMLVSVTAVSATSSAAYSETCTNVDPDGHVQKCDYTFTYAPNRCGNPTEGSVEGTYFLVEGMFVFDFGEVEEHNDAGYAVSGVYADDGLGLTYVEAFTYENNCAHGNGAALVLFAGPAGAIVHVNDANGAEVNPFLPEP